MSAWRILVRRLYDLGGGPLPRPAFDNTGDELGEQWKAQLVPAIRHGLIQSGKHKYGWRWTLTQRGRDWCEGRYEVVERLDNRRKGRGPQQIKATWLVALPRAGEIRL